MKKKHLNRLARKSKASPPYVPPKTAQVLKHGMYDLANTPYVIEVNNFPDDDTVERRK